MRRFIFALFLVLVWAVPVIAGHTVVSVPDDGSDLRTTPVVRAIQAVAPSVVNITTARVVEHSANPFGALFEDHFMHPLFRDFFGSQGTRQFTQQSLGSGIIFDGHKGLVLTNAHVISGATSITARLLDGRTFDAELVGSDPDFDLAVLHLKDAKDLPQVKVGRSSDLLIGETVIAIGNPFGFSHTVTTGVLSAVDRTVRTKQGTYTDFLQTDAAINPGNSGGPLLNIYGELIGVNTAIQQGAEGIGFAIPIDKAQRAVDELVGQGFVSLVWFGLSGQSVDPPTASYFGLDSAHGFLVTEVYDKAPAQAAKMKPGDLILSIEGHVVEDKEHYLQLLRNYTRGQKVHLEVRRQDGVKTLTIRPSAFPKDRALSMAWKRWGLGFGSVTTDGGLPIQRLRQGSPAQRLGLAPGDVLIKIGGVRLESQNDFAAAYARYRLQNSLLMLIWRDGRTYYVRLRV